MFTKADATKAPRSWKNTVIAALVGVACLGVGTQIYETVNYESPKLYVDALDAYTANLLDHHEYVADTKKAIDELIVEGLDNMELTADAIVDLSAAASTQKVTKTFKEKGSPALNKGTKALESNVKWGQKAGDKSVNPEKIGKTFADSAKFQAEIYKLFPKSVDKIKKLRQDLKVHHFDLSNTIKDVELLASSTSHNIKRSIKLLDLRKRYQGTPKLTASRDVTIWDKEIGQQTGDLDFSLRQCSKIVVILQKLQKDCARAQDDIEIELESMKAALKQKIAKKKIHIEGLEKQIRETKCKWWDALLTLGISCLIKHNMANDLRNVKAAFEREVEAARKLHTRMFYFDGLSKTAQTLVAEATGVLEITRNLESRLKDAKRELEQDFNKDEIEDNLWDEDFADDFAERLYAALIRVVESCDIAVKDCNDRLKRLRNALTWDGI